VGLFKKEKAMLAELHDLTAAMEPQLANLTATIGNPAAMASLTGTVDPALLSNGLLARGLIVSVVKTGTSVGSEHDPRPVCLFTVQVTLDNTPPYQAQFQQSVPLADVPQYVPGQTLVAIRVDPNDHNRVAMDRSAPPPTVTVSGQTTGAPTAASILATGTPVRAIIIQTQPMNERNPAGLDIYAFVLTILESGQAPRQLQIGNPVPRACVPLLYPGSNLAAKVSPNEPNFVAIDWDTALAEASR
jgi:hypothetical protein